MYKTCRAFLLLFSDANTQEEGEEQLVLLEQRAADVLVDAVGEVFVQVVDPLFQLLGRGTVYDGL